ncbi:hypothetical protein PSI19_08700 [Xenorhabdus khoisanae]|uniref:hypothetical protein n=1 Tax=Xenorhabdus khoisanae TaxID=880157 RepID=UPI002359FC76|nr:hypothetical protein [Xenorhabdus khoisanae]MDC9613950.1 hypothetical protein [Xenorhabdus khoisanae]
MTPNTLPSVNTTEPFLGSSGAEPIVARASLPIETPDKFKQAHHRSKISVAKMGVTIDSFWASVRLIFMGAIMI